MKFSPTIVATTVLVSDNSQALLDHLAELMRFGPRRLSDSYVVRIIYIELGKELARLQRKHDQLQSLLHNAGPNADADAITLVGAELEHTTSALKNASDILNRWTERFPRCTPQQPMTLARAKALLAVQPK